jgi:scyllo-inosose 3-dehydrogenase
MKGLLLNAKWDPRPTYDVSDWEKKTGKAVEGFNVWREPKLEITDVPNPTPGPGEALIKIHACGVCGSDMHFYETDSDNYILYPGLTKFPAILGHEFSGEIVEIGPGPESEGFKVGDRVTVEEMVWCGYCRPCRDGYPNHCENLEEIGFTIDGAMAEYIVVPIKLCWSVDAVFERYGNEQLAWDVAATTEPTCVAYNTIFERAGGFRPGAYVAIYGAGPIGLAAIQLSKAAGAARVFSFEVSAARRELAEAVGADFVYDPREVRPSEIILQKTKGQGIDLSVEAAGAPDQTVPEMEKTIAINGKVAQVGRAAVRVPMYLETFQVRRGSLFGAQGHSGHAIFPSVIRMMGAGLIDNAKIITSRFPLAQAVDAIAQSTDRSDGKIVVHPQA